MNLSRTEQLFLEAIKASLHEESVSWDCIRSEEWEMLMKLAAAHKVQPLVLNAVYRCPAAQQWEQLSAQKRIAKMQVMSQAVRTAEFLSVYDRLRSFGCKPLVVKGLVCRATYSSGDLRQSADEDLFAAEPDFSACCRVLESSDMVATTEQNSTDTYEIGWRKPNSPLYIELHKSLFSPESSAVNELQGYFTDAFERAQEYQIDGCKVLSLCPHDHLLYLILHAYKHFIHSGFGIRQICDVGLWVKKYSDEIDWAVLYEQCREVHALKFAAAMLDVAKRQLEIDISLPSEWNEIQVDGEPLLKDSLRAGIYGSSDQSRAHSASVTYNSVAAERKNKRSSLLHTVLPGKKKLEKDYPILKKSAVFLPCVWCVRLWKYWKETKSDPDNQMTETLRIAKERKELLQYYEIIDS